MAVRQVILYFLLVERSTFTPFIFSDPKFAELLCVDVTCLVNCIARGKPGRGTIGVCDDVPTRMCHWLLALMAVITNNRRPVAARSNRLL